MKRILWSMVVPVILVLSLGGVTVPVSAIEGTVPNGQIVFVSDRSGNEEIYLMNPDGANPVLLTNDPAHDRHPALSPDGTRIVFCSDRNGAWQIFTLNIDDPFNTVTALTAVTDYSYAPAWSPTGQMIAFESLRADDTMTQIYVMDADGGNQARVTNDQTAFSESPVFSPDCDTVYFTSTRSDGYSQIYQIYRNGSIEKQVTTSPSSKYFPAVSPDGTRIAFVSNGDIFLRGIWENLAETAITTGTSAESPAWSMDSAFLTYADYDGTDFEIRIVQADGSNPTPLTMNTDFDNQPDWGTPAGKIQTHIWLESNLNPSHAGESPYPGQEVTFRAGVSGSPIPGISTTGTIQFKDGNVNLGNSVAVNSTFNGATFTTSDLAAGSHNITAVFSGDAVYAPCSSPVLVQEVYPPKPDLIVSEMNVFKDGNFDQYRVGYAIRNIGTKPALWGYDVSLYADGVLKETRKMDSGIAPGWYSSTAFSYPVTVSGFFDEVTVTVDTNQRNDEINEENNSLSQIYYKPPSSPINAWLAYTSDKTNTIDEGPFALDREIYVMSAAGGNDVFRLTDNDADDFRPVISPDGSTVIFTSDRSGSYRLYQVSKSGGEAVCLTPDDPETYADNNYEYSYGVWSPTSGKIAFLLNDGVNENVWVMNPDGSGKTALTTLPSGENAFWPNFNEDGSQVLFTAPAGDYLQVFAVNSDGSAPAGQVTDSPFDKYYPAVSPDGTGMVFSGDTYNYVENSGLYSFDIFYRDAATGEETMWFGRDTSLHLTFPAWSLDGQYIVFTGNIYATPDKYKDLYYGPANGSGVYEMIDVFHINVIDNFSDEMPNLGTPNPVYITVTSDINPSWITDTVTFTATVSTGAGAMSGVVRFYINDSYVGYEFLSEVGEGVYTANRAVSFPSGTLSVGSNAVTVTYEGDSFHQPGSGSMEQIILGQPDLRVSELHEEWVNPQNPGDGYRVYYTVENSGSADVTDDFDVRLTVDGEQTQVMTISDTLAADGGSVKAVFPDPVIMEGDSDYVQVEADINDGIAELYENNNFLRTYFFAPEGIEAILNGTFSNGLNHWIVNPRLPETWEPLSEGVVSLNPPVHPFSGTVIYQNLNVTEIAGKQFTLAADMLNESDTQNGRDIEVYLVWLDNENILRKELVLNPENASVSWQAPTRVTGTFTADAGARKLVQIIVVKAEGWASFTIDNISLMADSISVGPVPQITSVSPEEGPYGTSVTLAGTGFGSEPGLVTFGGSDGGLEITGWSDTSVSLDVESPAGSGPVRVTIDFTESNIDKPFTVTSPYYSLNVLEDQVSVIRGDIAAFPVRLDFFNGFINTSGITFSMDSGPHQYSTFTPASLAGPGATLLRIDTSALEPGMYSISIASDEAAFPTVYASCTLNVLTVSDIVFSDDEGNIITGKSFAQQGIIPPVKARAFDAAGNPLPDDFVTLTSADPAKLGVYKDDWEGYNIYALESGTVDLIATTPDGYTESLPVTITVPATPRVTDIVLDPAVISNAYTGSVHFSGSGTMLNVSFGFPWQLAVTNNSVVMSGDGLSFSGDFEIDYTGGPPEPGQYLFRADSNYAQTAIPFTVVNDAMYSQAKGAVVSVDDTIMPYALEHFTLEFYSTDGVLQFSKLVHGTVSARTVPFDFGAIPPGTYKIRYVPGEGILPQWFTNANSFSDAADITFTAGEVVEDIFFFAVAGETKPDLVISEIHEEWQKAEGLYKVFFTVQNIGSGTAPSGIDIGISIDGIPVDETVTLPDALNPGNTWKGSFSTVFSVSDESDSVAVTADVNQACEELNEDNNTLTRPVAIHAYITGQTRDVNGNILPDVSVTVNGNLTVLSDIEGNYQVEVMSIGNHTLVAQKTGYRGQSKSIEVISLADVYTFDFTGNDGLVPGNPDMPYVLACINLWKFPLQDGTDVGLSKVLSVINAWNFPVNPD